MPRWPEQRGLTVERLAFSEDGTRAVFDGSDWDALVFDGIGGGAYEVAVNGEVVLRDTSMFASHRVGLADRLRAQGNVVEIRALPFPEVPRRPRRRWRTKVVEDAGTLRWFRQAVIGRAPGFAPGPSLSGAFRPAWLVRGTPVERPVRTRLDGEEGAIAVDAEAVILDGARFPVVDGVARVGTVEPWWPHTHGDPKLYDLKLVVDGGAVVGVGRVGFRSVASPDPDAFGLVVNGVPVFARGAVWTPVAEDEVGSTLLALRDAGANLVRIPGIGVPETPAFWDACDALGLLVWQDFLYANMDYPFADEAFRAVAVSEARELVSSIAGRPSLAVLCGNSEVEQQAAMFGVDPAAGRGAFFGEVLPALAREAGADVPYVPSAPSGGPLPFHPGHGVANYFGVGGYRRPLSDARAAGVRFASECLAIANVPDGEEPDAGFVPRDVGADWDFADVREHYARELYGDAATGDPAASAALARQVSGEVMTRVFGEWRRAASPCAGGIVLWARDLEPGSGWGLIDAAGRPKVALAHLRRAWAPRAVWLVDEGLGGVDVHVANDRPEPWRAELEVALLADGAHVVAEAREALVVPAHGSLVRNVEGLLGRFADAAYAYRFGPPAHDAVVARIGDVVAAHFPVGPPVERVAFGLDARVDGDAVVLCAERLAWGVRIEGDGVVAEDDAFVLWPGVERRVRVAGDARGARVTALNLSGEAAVGAPDVAA